jgi:CRP-like cAMP-binding protein
MPSPLQSSLAQVWGLSPVQAGALAREARTLTPRRGEVIARRGSLLPGVLFLAAGMVKLSLRGADGEERILRIVDPGQAFGETTAMLGRRCLYDATALSDARLTTVAAKVIFRLMARDTVFAKRLVMALAEHSFALLTELEAATTQRGAQRLAGYLEALSARKPANGAYSVDLPVSKTVVAARLGMKKETLSRLLHQFVADGIIQMRRREIQILDSRKLALARTSGL